MPDYSPLFDRCEYVNRISSKVIDQFLIYHAANRDKVDREFDTKITRFKEVLREMPSSWVGRIKAQYIAHRIFRERGLIHKYLKSAAIKERDDQEQELLRDMAAHPWRFCFSVIRQNLAPNLYEMEDINSGETFKLYSPSISLILAEHPILLWFTLIGNNGLCYQTYGPVTPFPGFDADDIVFYATEWDKSTGADDDLAREIEENPIRYMILAVGSSMPLVLQRGHEVVQVVGETEVGDVDTAALSKSFTVAYVEPVYRLTPEEWSAPPHYAEAYYDEEEGSVFVISLTDRGYRETVALLNRQGVEVSEEPDIRLHPSMAQVIEKVFKRKTYLNPYSSLFEKDPSPETAAAMDKLNNFFNLALPYLSSDEEPPIDELAREAGVDPAVARDMIERTIARMNELRKKGEW